MRLTERQATFWTHRADRRGMGLHFRCPCSPGCDRVISVPFENPVDGGGPEPSAQVTWHRTGETLETLTLTPSIDFRHVAGDFDPTPAGWHGWVRDGELVNAGG